MHAYQLTPAGVQNLFGIEAAKQFGATFGVMYGRSAVVMILLHYWTLKNGQSTDEPARPESVNDENERVAGTSNSG